MSGSIIDTIDEEGDAVIRLTFPDGTVCDYPYADQSERADQLRNARGDCQGFTVSDDLQPSAED